MHESLVVGVLEDDDDDDDNRPEGGRRESTDDAESNESTTATNNTNCTRTAIVRVRVRFWVRALAAALLLWVGVDILPSLLTIGRVCLKDEDVTTMTDGGILMI